MSSNDAMSRGFVKYTSRDYDSLMKEFWDIVPKLTELWRPEAESDPGVVLGKFLASVADMLGVNLDWLANEVFGPSVSQRKNAEKLFGLIGYHLGWYTAARTEVTFINASEETNVPLDFSFSGNFATLNAYTDITNQSRVITYNILPRSSGYGDQESRSRHNVITEASDVFNGSDKVILKPGQSVTRVAIEGELRSASIPVSQVKQNNYIINLPSQHVDTTAVWLRAKPTRSSDSYTQWIQCTSPSEFIEPEPRFAVTYDSYSNARIQVSNYLDQLENYDGSIFTVYWIDCSGVIGCVGTDVLSDFLPAADSDFESYSDAIHIHNLSNIVELPHTNTVAGKSPETAKEAYLNSRNYINTFDSLVTLPDYNRFLNREPGVDCGLVIDCQKALEINLAIYRDHNLTEDQKRMMYLTNYDFPEDSAVTDWSAILGLNWDLEDTETVSYKPMSNFKPYTAMCFAIHNDFNDTEWGNSQIATAQINKLTMYTRYKPSIEFINNVIRDYRPLQAMSVELKFGYVRVFPFHVVGTIYPKTPISRSVASVMVSTVKEALALYFAPSNRKIGQFPTLMEIVNVVRNADENIDYFDSGNLLTSIINWIDCDIKAFNPISFARYMPANPKSNLDIQVSSDYILDN